MPGNLRTNRRQPFGPSATRRCQTAHSLYKVILIILLRLRSEFSPYVIWGTQNQRTRHLPRLSPSVLTILFCWLRKALIDENGFCSENIYNGDFACFNFLSAANCFLPFGEGSRYNQQYSGNTPKAAPQSHTPTSHCFALLSTAQDNCDSQTFPTFHIAPCNANYPSA